MKTLGTKRPWGIIELMESNDLPFCLRCGVEITEENDSGWGAFVDGHTSQKLCKICNETEEDMVLIKSKCGQFLIEKTKEHK